MKQPILEALKARHAQRDLLYQKEQAGLTVLWPARSLQQAHEDTGILIAYLEGVLEGIATPRPAGRNDDIKAVITRELLGIPLEYDPKKPLTPDWNGKP